MRIHFSDQELHLIEAAAPKHLQRAEQQRGVAREELERRRLQAQRDLNYLRDNKISLLREGDYAAADYTAEVRRIEAQLAALDEERQRLETVPPDEMLQTILRFSELVRLAQQSYKHAPPEKKHRLVTTAFSELRVIDRTLAEVSAKAGFAELLKRPVTSRCGPSYVFSELSVLYAEVTTSLGVLKMLRP